MISFYTYCFFLFILFICFPNESLEIGLVLGLRLRTIFLNAVLLAYSLYFYIKLTWGLRSSGLPVPPFSFTPIQHRDNV